MLWSSIEDNGHHERKRKMGIEYIVNIDYRDYKFMSGETALSFAEIALASSTKSDVRVSITLQPVPNAEEGEKEDDDF